MSEEKVDPREVCANRMIQELDRMKSTIDADVENRHERIAMLRGEIEGLLRAKHLVDVARKPFINSKNQLD